MCVCVRVSAPVPLVALGGEEMVRGREGRAVKGKGTRDVSGRHTYPSLLPVPNRTQIARNSPIKSE